MAWSPAFGSIKAVQGECDENLGSDIFARQPLIPQELNKGGSKKRYRRSPPKEELDDDDLGDELSNPTEKNRRLTAEQVNFLEMSFNIDLKLEPERKALLAKKLGIRPRQVAIWFQNRRARWKNKQIEQDYESLKTKYEAVIKEREVILLQHEAAMQENKRLQAEVRRLMDLVEATGVGACDVTGVSEGKSELMSPSKSTEDQSDMQDSSQSHSIAGSASGTDVPMPRFELDYGFCRSNDMGVDCMNAPPLPVEDIFGSNLPLFVRQFASNDIYYEDGSYFNYEDQFNGLTYLGYVETSL
ncbi:hypothetical protein KP509_14G007200 [Ceratopteris richardii]|uniref:Homeobox domain-containing protein n=1 Tax=Ceratopteris richardii TaxID=49495 RepID=A0A8T2T798_CERRI|nr:hypothetical protein KP509_14G007200 [Ceratopteris richardii]